jgi:hypothetical protein
LALFDVFHLIIVEIIGQILSLQTKAKLVCRVLSLPVPPDSKNSSGEQVNVEIPANLAQKSLHKFLLVGYDKSGTSTIYKQVKY